MEILYFVKNFKKNGCICTTLVGGWEALGPFKLCVRCLLESKSVFSSCRWKRYRVLFLMELQVFPLVVWFCTGELFFSPSSLSPSLKNYSLVQLQSLPFWFLFFGLDPFVDILSVIDFVTISIYQKLYSSMWYSLFGFLIFFLALFKKF